MDNLVSNENMKSLLLGIKTKILTDINSKDITEDQKVILNKVNNMISNGNGLKILTDNGSYKDCNAEELKTAINNTDNVFDLFNISVSHEKWETKASMPTAKYGIAAQLNDDKIYVIGGWDKKSYLNKLDCYDITTDTWNIKENMPTARYIIASGAYKNNIYAIGGVNTSLVGINECYDILTNTWSIKSNMITARAGMAYASYNNKIYCIGGGLLNSLYTNVNESYDAITDSWTTNANCPKSLQHSPSVIYKDKIYVFGGYDATSFYKNTRCYDIITNTWSEKMPMLYARINISCNIYKDKIYVFGGNTNNNTSVDYNEEYDITTDTWSSKLKMSYAKYSAASSIYKNKIYIIGGNKAGDSTCLNTNEVYTVDDSSYDLILPDTIRSKLDIIVQNGTGLKVLSDNGNYIDIPKGYRYMNEEEVNNLISEVTK